MQPVTIPDRPIKVHESNVAQMQLALRTLASFQFPRHALRTFLLFITNVGAMIYADLCKSQGYLTCVSTGVREAAVHCTVRLLVPFVMLLGKVDDDHVLRAELLHVVHSTLHNLLVVGVADPGEP